MADPGRSPRLVGSRLGLALDDRLEWFGLIERPLKSDAEPRRPTRHAEA